MRKLAYLLLVGIFAACSQQANNGGGPDSLAPELEVVYGADPGLNAQATSSLKLMVQGTASDNVGVTKVTYQLNDGPENAVAVTTSTSATFKFSLTLPQGTSKITVNAYDAANNKGSFSFTLTWNPGQPGPDPIPNDTTPPTVSITDPVNNTTLSSASVTVKGSAKDNTGVVRLAYKLNGAAEKDITISKGTTASYSFTLSNLASGSNTLRVNAYDTAGNKGSSTINLTYSSSNPTPPPPAPTPGSWWKPSPNAPISWHWQLSQDFQVPRDVKQNVYVYDFDGEQASADTVKKLKDWGAAQGKQVIAVCYIDVGVYEDYRSDIQKFKDAQDQLRQKTGDANAKLWGNKDAGWNGSYWLDVRQIDLLKPIMEARIRDWCKGKGFDAVEPDESEVWNNNPGFPITMEQSHAYTKMIADLVHSYGMSVGLKGNNGEAALLEPYHDWALTEECFQYGECQKFVDSFIKKGKAVFNIEYSANPDCTFANKNRINSAKRDLNLVGPTASGYLYQPCMPDGSTAW